MVTNAPTIPQHSAELVLGTLDARTQPQGAFWPRSRVLADELTHLFTMWPVEAGRIARVLYSPPDWDDRPRAVPVPGRQVKTGCFPRDDTHLLTLVMADATRRTLVVVPPETPVGAAEDVLASFRSPDRTPAG
ncbi:DUF5994 family protein [Nocardioides sp. CPCC 205120]|uniref:DUF5994 family protein n=1 Tax=Nocardioides sp. CPCC 205120 TaxID=3406462 RepID=UPI003B509378